MFICRYRLILKLASPLFTVQASGNMSVFVGVSDRFKGITVTSKEEPCSIEHFTEKLKASLEKWTSEVRNTYCPV